MVQLNFLFKLINKFSKDGGTDIILKELSNKRSNSTVFMKLNYEI